MIAEVVTVKMKLVVLMFLSLLALSSAIDYGDNVSPIAYLQSNNLNTGKPALKAFCHNRTCASKMFFVPFSNLTLYISRAAYTHTHVHTTHTHASHHTHMKVPP